MADSSGQTTGWGDGDPDATNPTQDRPFGGASGIETRIRALQAQRTTFRDRLSVGEEAKRRNIHDRSWIAKAIVTVYVLGLIVLLTVLSVKFPVLICDNADGCAGAVAGWKDMASVLLNVVAVAVLPVVTLVLGFYFGSETGEARAEDPSRSAE